MLDLELWRKKRRLQENTSQCGLQQEPGRCHTGLNNSGEAACCDINGNEDQIGISAGEEAVSIVSIRRWSEPEPPSRSRNSWSSIGSQKFFL